MSPPVDDQALMPRPAPNPQAPAALVRRDPAFAPLVESHPRPPALESVTAFHYLAKVILYQQLAGKAAATIYRRLVASFERRPFPSPQELSAAPMALFRGAGVSQQKERYLRDLAAHFADERINPHRLPHLDDDGVRETITDVLGIGRWTADIFLMSWLARPDVLPADDLGIRKGVQLLRGLEELPSAAEVAEIGEAWAPYRSTASWYLWRSLDGE